MTSEENSETSLAERRISGTEVHYFALCPRKLWWYAHGLEQEHVTGGVGQENVALGTLLHQESYPAQTRKDILVDGLIRLDFTEDGLVHEIKKSKGGEQATRFQLLYYLYYLKHIKGIETSGVIDYPLQKRRQPVALTPELEADVARLLDAIEATRQQPTPPIVSKPLALCKQCAYQELCWG